MPKIREMLSIVVPAFNEQDNIEPFRREIQTVLDRITSRWEIVFVNDGSTDATLSILLALHDSDPRIKVINLSRNFGKEAALTAGLDHAQGDAVVPIDVDLQDPPELIEKMVELWQQGNDVVYATRELRHGESWLKKFTATYFYQLISKISPLDIPRDTGDFRLIDRKVLESIQQLRETHRFMKGLFSWVGYKQVSIVYDRNPRHKGKTKYNYWKLWNFAIEGITSFSIAPLQLATYFGLLVSLFAFCYGIFIIGKTIIYGIDVPGYASLMVTLLFLGGVQLISIGILGEYLGRIYGEVKKRPLYLVQDTYGIELIELPTSAGES